MHRFVRATVAAVAAAAAIAVGAPGLAAAGPVITLFQTPTVSSGVAPLTWFTVTPAAVTGEQPRMTTFTVPHTRTVMWTPYRYITIHWRNVQTGATGDVELRYSHNTGSHDDASYATDLPTSTTVETGSGLIVATVTHHSLRYQAPPVSNAVLMGTWAFMA